MITIVVSRQSQHSVVLIEKEDREKMFVFRDARKAQDFLDNLFELFTFLGVEYTVERKALLDAQ